MQHDIFPLPTDAREEQGNRQLESHGDEIHLGIIMQTLGDLPLPAVSLATAVCEGVSPTVTMSTMRSSPKSLELCTWEALGVSQDGDGDEE